MNGLNQRTVLGLDLMFYIEFNVEKTDRLLKGLSDQQRGIHETTFRTTNSSDQGDAA